MSLPHNTLCIRWSLPVACGLAILGFLAPEAHGQLGGANVGRSGNFGGISNIGQFRNSRSGGFSPVSASQFGGASQPPLGGGNYLGTRSANAFGSRRGGRTSQVMGMGTRNIDMGRSFSFQYIGRSPSATFFDFSSYTGRGVNYPHVRPTFEDTEILKQLYSAHANIVYSSFQNRVALPTAGRFIRDDLTNTSLENAPPVPDLVYDASFDPWRAQESRVNHSDLFATRLQASHDRYIEQGFAFLSEKDFMRAHSAFESATLVDRDALTPRVGRFLCSLLGAQRSMAGFELKSILADYDQPFELDERFREVLHSSGQAEGAILRSSSMAGVAFNDDSLAATYAYLLWIDGQRTAALSAAERLRDKFRDSPFAVMAEGMRDQILRDRATAQSGEPASG